MNTCVTLKLSGESMDALFVDLLDDNLELILNPDVKFIHPDDYGYNLTLADAIMTVMMYQKDAFVFDKWCADVYVPMLNKYEERYNSLTSEEEEEEEEELKACPLCGGEAAFNYLSMDCTECHILCMECNTTTETIHADTESSVRKQLTERWNTRA